MGHYIHRKGYSDSFSIYYYVHNAFKLIENALFIFACIALLITSKVNKDVSNNIASFFVDVSVPIAKVGAAPFNVFVDILSNLGELSNAREENELLKIENKGLKSLYINALSVYQENRELRKILRFVDEKTARYKTARLIGYSSQIFGQSVFIDAGSKHGIKEDGIVTGNGALIGRVVQVGEEKSRVLLIEDVNSRIPVITSRSRQRGILAGNNSGSMEMLYLSKDHNIVVGDQVFTSGDGESLPPSLLVGVVTYVTKDKVVVKMTGDINSISLVSIISY